MQTVKAPEEEVRSEKDALTSDGGTGIASSNSCRIQVGAASMVVVVVVLVRHKISCTGENVGHASYYIVKSDPGQLCWLARLSETADRCSLAQAKLSFTASHSPSISTSLGLEIELMGFFDDSEHKLYYTPNSGYMYQVCAKMVHISKKSVKQKVI